MTIKLLISGSRKADTTLLQYTHSIVERAKANGFHVICTDEEGVASQTFWSCEEFGTPYTVYGVQDKPRNNAPISNYAIIRPARTFTQRDESMVNKADKIMCIWNGESKGTVRVAQYARSIGKEFWLYGVWQQKGVRNLTNDLDAIIDEVLK